MVRSTAANEELPEPLSGCSGVGGNKSAGEADAEAEQCRAKQRRAEQNRAMQNRSSRIRIPVPQGSERPVRFIYLAASQAS